MMMDQEKEWFYTNNENGPHSINEVIIVYLLKGQTILYSDMQQFKIHYPYHVPEGGEYIHLRTYVCTALFILVLLTLWLSLIDLSLFV